MINGWISIRRASHRCDIHFLNRENHLPSVLQPHGEVTSRAADLMAFQLPHHVRRQRLRAVHQFFRHLLIPVVDRDIDLVAGIVDQFQVAQVQIAGGVWWYRLSVARRDG